MPKPKRASVPREAWAVLAAEYAQLADELLWLVGRSIEVVDAALQDRDLIEQAADGPDAPALQRMQLVRGRAEGLLSIDPDAAGRNRAGAYEDEWICLLTTLLGRTRTLTRSAEACQSLAAQERRGRPRKPRPRHPNALLALIASDTPIPPAPAKPGRKLALPVSDAELLRAVEAGRAAGHRTERESLQALVSATLSAAGRHSVGARVPALVKNLQRRLSELRAVRKRSEKPAE